MKSHHTSAVVVATLLATLALQPTFEPPPASANTVASGAVSVSYTSYNVDEGPYRQSPQADKSLTPMSNSAAMTINIDPSVTFQTYGGWGSSLEDATIYHLGRLSAANRERALQDLVNRASGNNLNLWRTTIGCADFCRTAKTTGYWTYADNGGIPDPTLASFSIARDIADGKVDVMRRMREINPEVRFYASMWSPPAWMKTTNSITGPEGVFGHCRTDGTEPRVQHGSTGKHHTGSPNDYYPVLADYYVKYLQAYAAEGIPIYAVTLQNEPDIQMPYPTTCFTPGQMQDFALVLKQALNAAGLTTKIWGMDANLTGETFDYIDALLGEPAANAAVDGIAYHNYDNTNMWQPNAVAAQYPDKTQHLTEITQGANKLIEFLRGGVSSYSGWATMFEYSQCDAVDDATNDIVLCNAGPSWWMDRRVNPNDPDADTPSLISPRSGDPTQYDLNGWYYVWGQFSRHLQLGAKRIDSTDRMGTVSNVAFQNPDGTVVVVVANRPDATGRADGDPARYNTTTLATGPAPIRIATPDGEFTDTIPGDTIATYVYTPTTGGALDRAEWSASASHTSDAFTATQAIDGATRTRWMAGVAQAAGQSFSIDLGAQHRFDQITLNQIAFPTDAPAGYQVQTSSDGIAWSGPIAVGTGTSSLTNIALPATTARHVRITLTAAAPRWWSIGEVSIYDSTAAAAAAAGPAWTVLDLGGLQTEASHNPAAADLAVDQWLGSRWQSNQAQAGDEWFEVDLGAAHEITGVQLVHSGGPDNGGGDFPRGYEVYVSTDKATWTKVAAGDGYGVITALFEPRTARYVNVHNTTPEAGHWWSIGTLNVLAASP